MIQPLHGFRETWALNCFELDLPVQFGALFILPTCLYAVNQQTRVLIGHDFARELEQRRTEIFLHRLFQEKGAPDELVVPKFEEFDDGMWQDLSREYRCQINLVDVAKKDELGAEEKEVQSQIRALIAGSAETVMEEHGDLAVAQGLVRAVKQTRSREKKRALIGKALELVEDLPDALVERADLELQEGSMEAAAGSYEAAAKNAAPLHQEGKLTLYLRAEHGRMLTAWQKGDVVAAIAIGEEVLLNNPVDYTGVRFVLPLLQLAANETDAANEFYAWYAQTYPNDFEDPGLYLGWGFTAHDADEEKVALEKYRKAMAQNLFLVPLLLDLPEPAPDIWQHNERADVNYALDFVDSFGVIWEQDAAANRFMREVYVQSLPELMQIVDLRQRMAELQDHRYEPDHRTRWDRLLAEEQALLAKYQAGG